MRVLVVSSKFPPEYSGSGLRCYNTYKRFSKKFNIKYDLVTSSLESSGVCWYTHENKEVKRIAGIFKVVNFKGIIRKIIVWINFPFEIFSSWLFIRGKIDSYDMLHTFGDSWSIGFFTWYFSYFKKPIVRELCNEIKTSYYPYPFRKIVKKIFQKDNTMMIAISPMLESLAINELVKNIWHRPNPINEDIFNLNIRLNKDYLRRKITPYSEDNIVLTYVAMFWKNKNQRFLLRVLKKLSDNYKLVLVGPVPSVHKKYYLEVLDDIDKLNLNNRVFIVNKFIENPEEYIAMSDVYLFPSMHEGLGTPILEAQACGVPIVMNQLPGISDKWINTDMAGYAAPLNEGIWKRMIEKALNIEEYKLQNNSKFITNIAGSSVIDHCYFEKFKEVIGK